MDCEAVGALALQVCGLGLGTGGCITVLEALWQSARAERAGGAAAVHGNAHFAILRNAAAAANSGVADRRRDRGHEPRAGPSRADPGRLRDPQLPTAEAPRAGSVLPPTAHSPCGRPRPDTPPPLAS